jgi:HEAT repeat protein
VRLPLCVVLLAFSVVAPGLARADGQELPFDVSGSLRAQTIAELEGTAGPVTLGQVILQNIPTEEDVKNASPRERTRVKAVLVVGNTGRRTATLTFQLKLEDEAGAVLMTCAYQAWVKPGANELVHQACNRENLLLRDWPRVQVVRVVGKVQD